MIKYTIGFFCLSIVNNITNCFGKPLRSQYDYISQASILTVVDYLAKVVEHACKCLCLDIIDIIQATYGFILFVRDL